MEQILEMYHDLGHYDNHLFDLGYEKRLYIFDSRGMEYKDELIRLFISQYKDANWYCVEENYVEEGHYYWNSDHVVLDTRSLCQGFRENDICVRFELSSYQPILIAFCSSKELIIEYILQNRASKYALSDASSQLVMDFFTSIISKAANDAGSTKDGVYYEFGIPEIFGIRRDISLHLSHNTLDVMCYDNDDEWRNEIPNGEQYFCDTIDLLKAIVQQEYSQEQYELESRMFKNDIHELK